MEAITKASLKLKLLYLGTLFLVGLVLGMMLGAEHFELGQNRIFSVLLLASGMSIGALISQLRSEIKNSKHSNA